MHSLLVFKWNPLIYCRKKNKDNCSTFKNKKLEENEEKFR